DLRPGIEAVVVALAGDSAVAELEKDREARAQLPARLERAGLDPDGPAPAQLESDVVAVRDRGEHLEPFGAQQALAANARLLQRRQVAGRAVWKQPVRELLLNDVGREELREVVGAHSGRKALDV